MFGNSWAGSGDYTQIFGPLEVTRAPSVPLGAVKPGPAYFLHYVATRHRDTRCLALLGR